MDTSFADEGVAIFMIFSFLANSLHKTSTLPFMFASYFKGRNEWLMFYEDSKVVLNQNKWFRSTTR